MSFRDVQNPGIGGLDELTLSEEQAIQLIAGLGSPLQVLRTNAAGDALEFASIAAGGDVTKVGTPVDNQVGVWTGNGTIEGDAALTFDTTVDKLSAGGTTGSVDTGTIELGHATDTTISRASAGQIAVEGVNVLMNGGALGTPSSGTVTNLTGTASININGTVGATTPSTVVGTTITANTGIVPDINDGAYLGQAGLGFSDLFLAEGGVINWDSSDVTLTQSGNSLTLAGGDLLAGSNHIRFGTADGTAFVDIQGVSGAAQGLRIEGALATDISFSTFVAADSFLRFSFRPDGLMQWGSGALSSDTNLYRSAASVLKTDDLMVASLGFQPASNDGAALGVAGTAFSDLFLASGATISFDSGNTVLTHSAGVLTLSNTNPGANGPIFEIYQDSVSPAASDVVGEIRFSGEDSAGNKQQYNSIATRIIDPTSTSEDSDFLFYTTVAGTFGLAAYLSGTYFAPATNDVSSLGTTTAQWSDLFLAEGGVINWDNGDMTLTQTGNVLAVAGGNLSLETGSNILVNGSNPTRTLVLTAGGGFPSTTAGCATNTKVETTTNDMNYYVLDFDATTDENAEWTVIMPDSYSGGTITAVFYWTAASGSGDVIWAIQGRAFAEGDALDQAFGTAVTVTDTLTTANDLHISSATGACTLAGSPAGGQLVALKVYRDANAGGDTLGVDARLMAVKIEYPISTYSD